MKCYGFRIDVCNENGVGNITMCPNCEIRCPYWKLQQSCNLSYVAYVTDNSCTIAFSIIMSLWGKIFIWNIVKMNIAIENISKAFKHLINVYETFQNDAFL